MNKKKKILIIILILFIIALFVYLTIRYLKGLTYDPEKPYQTIKEAVEALGHTYIKEKKSKEEGFFKDIYLKFSADLYIEENSNEKIYNELIYTIARVEKYKSFRLIDSEKETVIAVLANEQEKELVRIYINGDDNYFGRHKSMSTIEKYKETPITEFVVQSNILKEIIKKDWSTKINLPQEYQKQDEYKVYETQGIKIKNVDNRIFNIVFTANYTEAIVNGIKIETNIWDVVDILGEPSFGKLSDGLIGYQGEYFMIFFSNSEISIYPNGKEYDKTEFAKLVQTYTEKVDAQNFVNQITKLWTDYDYFERDTNFVNLRYSLKGVEIQFNITSNHGVIIYSNYEGSITQNLNIDNLEKEKNNIPDHVFFERNINLVYKTEKERWHKQAEYDLKKQEYNPE